MKSTDNFKKVINEHLNQLAEKDPLFAETFKKPKKNIDDCVVYILNQVKASGCSGFTDAEVFAMAVHYYDEDDVKPGTKVNGNVVVNRSVELSEKELAKAKEAAIQKSIEEAKNKMTKKKSSKKEVSQPDQTSLF